MKIRLDDLDDETRTQVMDELGIYASMLDPSNEDYIGSDPVIAETVEKVEKV